MSTAPPRSALWPAARDDVDARTFLLSPPPQEWPSAVLYVSLPLLDHRIEACVAAMHGFGVPRTETFTNDDGSRGYQMKRARIGWRLGLSPALRLAVAGRGQCLVEIARAKAPQEWIDAVRRERQVYVFAGGPVPVVAGTDEGFAELLGWVCSHPTVGGLMPAVELP